MGTASPRTVVGSSPSRSHPGALVFQLAQLQHAGIDRGGQGGLGQGFGFGLLFSMARCRRASRSSRSSGADTSVCAYFLLDGFAALGSSFLRLGGDLGFSGW